VKNFEMVNEDLEMAREVLKMFCCFTSSCAITSPCRKAQAKVKDRKGVALAKHLKPE
jgi:hypothetical protein